jgi:nitroreductase
MEAIEALKTRRSIRGYTADPVDRAIIEDIVDCGRLAPTGSNVQPWEFVVVGDKALLRRFAELASYGKFLPQAAICIVVLCKETKYWLEDGSAATENMLLAARAYDLGACWVAGDKTTYAEVVRQEIGAPRSYKVVSLIAIGHPAEPPRKIERRQLADVLHWDRF